MDENVKPFACSIKGCDLTFTNADHLNCHQKRHDLMLNINCGSKSNDVADQTPTPTRFLRNCEEVGLFQDLQNVNPFEETFKKAVESKDSSRLLQEPASDDTLHTPHILPYIQENDSQYDHNENISCQSSDFALTNVITNTTNDKPIPTILIEEERSSSSSETPSIDVRNKIKRILLKNNKNISVQDVNVINNSTNNVIGSEIDKRQLEVNKEKIREMNRAAQHRCRKRKQLQMKIMEQEMMTLKQEIKRLCSENLSLKSENIKLKEMILKYQAQISASEEEKSKSNNESSMVVHIISPTSGNLCLPLINTIPSDSTIPVSTISQNTSEKKSVVLLQNPKHIKHRKFRKIIPKTKS